MDAFRTGEKGLAGFPTSVQTLCPVLLLGGLLVWVRANPLQLVSLDQKQEGKVSHPCSKAAAPPLLTQLMLRGAQPLWRQALR